MSRGRHPIRALEEADKIAKKRGLVHYYERVPGMIGDFSIAIPPCLAQVRIKRMRYLRCTMQWLEREAHEEISGLKMFPVIPGNFPRALDLFTGVLLEILPGLRHRTRRTRAGRCPAPSKISGPTAGNRDPRHAAGCSLPSPAGGHIQSLKPVSGTPVESPPSENCLTGSTAPVLKSPIIKWPPFVKRRIFQAIFRRHPSFGRPKNCGIHQKYQLKCPGIV